VYLAVYGVLSAASLGLMAGLWIDPRLMWASGPGQYFSMLQGQARWIAALSPGALFPSFVWPDSVRNPAILARGLAGAALVTLACDLAIRRRRRASALAAGWLCVLLLLGGAWFGASFDELRHKTLLAERRRWPAPFHLHDPRGVAVLGATAFLADYGERLPSGETRPGQLVALDLESGTWRSLDLRHKGRAGAWAHPGDVKAGGDGLLYVLNNGGGDADLLAVEPDGERVRGWRLERNTPTMKGLAFGPEGDIYVSDMVLGNISRYPRAGGPPAPAWGGQTGQFNNPQGIWVGPSGEIYASEGFQQVQVLAPDGSWSHSYDLDCAASAFAAPPGQARWLDFACDKGIRSLDIEARRVQLVRVEPAAPALGRPTGLCYAGGHTLYVFADDVLVEYQVRH
jgi:hypothetical protein